MEIKRSNAAVDTDFIIHLSECKIGIDVVIGYLREIFDDLKLDIIIHPLVYDNELLYDKPNVKAFFEQKIIERITFDSIFQGNENKKSYYIFLLSELYHKFNGGQFPFLDDDIFLCWCKGKSFGEIHTLSMCLIIGCGLFLSDDEDSKHLAYYIQTELGSNVNVYNRKELIDKHIDECGTKIPRKDRKSLSHI